MNILATLRTPRIGQFAIFDFAVSYGAALLAAPLVKSKISKERLLYLVLPAAILVHKLFKIDTPLTEMFFDFKKHWLLKAIVVGMVIEAFLVEKI